MRSIFRLHFMITKTPQKVHKICFRVICMTFLCEPPYQVPYRVVGI